jgi:RND family efflux transporter MFP subunit
MDNSMPHISNKWVILIPILIGVALVLILKQQQKEPEQGPLKETAQLVRVIKVPATRVVPTAIGHGTVLPSRTWEAVAQVKGKILEKHPRLERGTLLEAETLLLKIDPADYELAVAQSEADIAATRAQIAELDAKAKNSAASLKIEQEALALSRKELQRYKSVFKRGGISRSDLETQERNLLTQQQSVQNQKNSLNLIPSQKALLEAQLAKQEAQLAANRRDLAHTEVRLPFTGRIAEVNVELNQYVREGEVLTIADDLAQAEVEIQIPIERMAALIRSDAPINLLENSLQGADKRFPLKASIRLREGGIDAMYEGRFARFSDTLDTKTRTAGVIIEIDDPYSQVQPGVRPPLLKGMFVEAVLSGKPREKSLVVPRSALHNGKVYRVTSENRLQLQPVKIVLLQPEYAVISDGLAQGDRIVVSDLLPAIDGMLLRPVDAPEVTKELLTAAGPSE